MKLQLVELQSNPQGHVVGGHEVEQDVEHARHRVEDHVEGLAVVLYRHHNDNDNDNNTDCYHFHYWCSACRSLSLFLVAQADTVGDLGADLVHDRVTGDDHHGEGDGVDRARLLACMYVCMYIYIYTYICICVYKCTYMYMYIYIHIIVHYTITQNVKCNNCDT